MATDTTVPAGEPTAVEIAASMAQGVLALIPGYGLPASALVGGALQLAQMFNAKGKVITIADVEKIRDLTGTNLDAFSRKVDALPT